MSATMRPMMSVGPPGGNGMMTRTGLLGYCCACALAHGKTARTAATTVKRRSMAQSVNDIAAAHAAGRLAEARVLCERLLEREPGNGDAHMWHGLVAMAELRWEEAAGAFERALQARVEPWSYANLGACHSKLGRLDEAE